MAKKIITIFFLLLFVIQVLPLKQVGRLIAGATMTEELPDSGSSKSVADYLDAKWFYHPAALHGNDNMYNSNQSLYIHFSETLPGQLASDVQTPPPDIFC